MQPGNSQPSPDDDAISDEPALRPKRSFRRSDIEQPSDQNILDEPALLADPGLSHIVVQADALCPACGYNRRSMRMGDACPECGHRMHSAEHHQPEPETRDARMERDDLARHSIFNEPHVLDATTASLANEPGQLSYASWLREKITITSEGKSWAITALAALLGGMWAVGAAMFNNSTVGGSILLVAVIFAPVIEEVMKVAMAAWIVETRPYLFKSRFQVRVAIICSGAMFGILENIYYVTLILPAADAPPQMYTFRWIVCTALHITTTIVTSIGVARVWADTTTNLREPSLDRAYPWLLGGIIIHGLYNGGAVLFEISKNLF